MPEEPEPYKCVDCGKCLDSKNSLFCAHCERPICPSHALTCESCKAPVCKKHAKDCQVDLKLIWKWISPENER